MDNLMPSPTLTAGAGQQPNPWFTVANQFVPRNLHDVIRWARYITIQSPTTSEVIRKLATYPITDFVVDTEHLALKARYEHVIQSLKLKEVLQDAGFEFFTIGNVFLSLYFPSSDNWRVLPAAPPMPQNCQVGCVQTVGVSRECPICRYKGVFRRIDSKSSSIDDMNLVKWTPEHILVNHNPITGGSTTTRSQMLLKLKIQRETDYSLTRSLVFRNSSEKQPGFQV